MYWFLYVITWLFVKIFYPCKVVGKKNMLKQGGIYVCNHYSNVDVAYFGNYLNKKFYYLAKKELFKTKFKAWFLRQLGAIKIDREKVDIQATKKCLKLLKDKKRLVIFPEGTRNKINQDLQEIKNGSAMFAIKSKTPIIPVHIEKKAKLFHRNKLIIGEPFELSKFYDLKINSEVLTKASKVIEEKMQELYKK